MLVAVFTAAGAWAQEGGAGVRTFSPNQNIIPFSLEVPFNKTVHILFPSPIKYVDLGSSDLIAGKADGVENVVRVKAAVKEFKGETNFSVITGDGSFYSFMVIYNEDPPVLNINMDEWLAQNGFRKGGNSVVELGEEDPATVWSVMYTIHKRNKRDVRHLGIRQFDMESTVRGIYVHRDLLFLHLSVHNKSYVPYDIDFIRFKIVDKKVSRRTAVQETFIEPKRSYNEVVIVDGKKTERVVYALPKITIPDDKVLSVEIYERAGGRHMWFHIEHGDLIDAKLVNELKKK